MTTGSVGRGKAVDSMSAGELKSAARGLGDAYAASPNDKPTALRYASVLQMNGDTDQSLKAAISKSLIAHHCADASDLAIHRVSASRMPS